MPAPDTPSTGRSPPALRPISWPLSKTSATEGGAMILVAGAIKQDSTLDNRDQEKRETECG
jgi:hypothetical protein